MTRSGIKHVLSLIDYRDWSIDVVDTTGWGLLLRVRFAADGVIQHGRKWKLSRFMTKSEIVQTAFKAILTAEEHEVRERFRYRGAAIFGPHFDVDKLVGLAATPVALDARQTAEVA